MAFLWARDSTSDWAFEDWQRLMGRMRRSGVAFSEEPRREAYGTVAVFEDLYGNKWDLLQPGDPNTPQRLPQESR